MGQPATKRLLARKRAVLKAATPTRASSHWVPIRSRRRASRSDGRSSAEPERSSFPRSSRATLQGRKTSQIGRAACRERVGPYVETWVEACTLKKKTKKT